MKIRHGNDAIVSGLLDKIGRFSTRKRGFYQLTGSVLAKSTKKRRDEVQWEVDICDATLSDHGRNGFMLQFQKTVVVLYARNYDDWKRWYTAFEVAVKQKVENFYTIGAPIGEGGFATVYKAKDIESQEVVALKTIDKSGSSKAFLSREVDILKRMDSRYVCSTYDIFETTKELHLILEYMDGGSLYDILEEREKLPEQEVRLVMRQILAGVLYMHTQGAVHRDLKPENILVVRENRLDDIRLGDCKFHASLPFSFSGVQEMPSEFHLTFSTTYSTTL